MRMFSFIAVTIWKKDRRVFSSAAGSKATGRFRTTLEAAILFRDKEI